ncbi:LacI family DNA-binding transcriptional regulator [Danxiaibacter flavus]|uniref:LacI family DNA-binding transcriptional regulator n=1 Tax=Danxiaibacter flavus TaxID=3049108 RepID=A0ABV3ZAH8_9BACT|nr:LacI family DNA-binding transcriptional regulator [Chitinophagaceae bacterium DXS]
MSTITIKQLAQELNLSAGTVSKALKDSHEISAETKKRVREMAKDLDYVPNPYASSLRRRKSKTIAVVLPDIADSFFSAAIKGIETVAQDKGYHVLVYLTHELSYKECSILNDFKSGRVDGVLISVSRETTENHHVNELQANGIPVVFFDRVLPEINTAKVVTNDFEAARIATKHLIEKGCHRIAYLSFSRTLSISMDRLEGYKQALCDAGMEHAIDVVFCCNDEDENNRLIKEALSRQSKPDGILASAESLTIVAYHVCHEMGIKIPDDIKIVSFSNLATALILNPSLTTISQPAFEMGESAALLLFKSLEKNNFVLEGEQIVIPSVLMERQSTACSGVPGTELNA